MIQTRTTTGRICEPLYFLHIPKTAGTSVRSWLQELFGFHDWLPCHILDEVKRKTREEINEHVFFSGHFGWHLLNYLDETPRVVTWLRDPVQREWSTIRFNRSRFNELSEIAVKNNRLDWLEYFEFVKHASTREILESKYYLGHADNFQVRHLAGLAPRTEACVVDEHVLEIAKQNLQDMLAFGISEWMGPSVDYLSFKLNQFHRPMNHRLNVGKSVSTQRSADLAPEDIALMRHLNRFDQALYEFACGLFIERMKEMIQLLGCDVNSDRIDNWLTDYDRHPQTASLRQAIDAWFQISHQYDYRPPGAVIRFAEPTFLRGWHRCMLSSEGKVIRWAGPEPRASVFVALEPGRRYRVETTLVNITSRRVVRSLHMSLGDVSRPVSWYKLPSDEGQRHQYLVEAVFPANAVAEDVPYTELVLENTSEMGSFAHDPSVKVSVATEGFTITAEGN